MELGGHHSEETKAKIRVSCKNIIEDETWLENKRKGIIKYQGKKIHCIETGKEFNCISDAARELNIQPIQISRVCHGHRNHVHKLSFRFNEDIV